MTTKAEHFNALMMRFSTRSANVGVVGLGYVGLPLMAACHNKVGHLVGYDCDSKRVRQLLSAETSPVESVSAETLQYWHESGRVRITDDPSLLSTVDVIVICVPTPVDDERGQPDLSCVDAAAAAVKGVLRPGQLIILESTSWPGTTRNRVGGLLRSATGLVPGEDFFLAFSPERENPGDKVYKLQTIPKLVSGVCEQSCLLAEKFYYWIVSTETVLTSSCEVAEMAKLLENAYRLTNVMLINEIKAICDESNIDVWEVIEAAKTKPFGFQAFYPGPGVGGHCVPVDPVYLQHFASERTGTPILDAVIDAMDVHPVNVHNRIAEALVEALQLPLTGDFAIDVGYIGVAYKPNVSDCRNSPAEALLRYGSWTDMRITYHDPHVSYWCGRHSQPLTAEWLQAQAAVVMLVDHEQLRDQRQFILDHAPLVLDTCNAFKGYESCPNLRKI
jgi:UDP-N-acetyl-D-glucosamine dehydrogenase